MHAPHTLCRMLERVATAATHLALLTGCNQPCEFQLFDFGELARRHLLHQIEDGLLFDFANLYELHGGNSK
jgi:hypothetical protein